MTNGMQTQENKSPQLASWNLIANWKSEKNSGCRFTNGMQPKENNPRQLASWLLIVNWFVWRMKKQWWLYDQWHANKRK